MRLLFTSWSIIRYCLIENNIYICIGFKFLIMQSIILVMFILILIPIFIVLRLLWRLGNKRDK